MKVKDLIGQLKGYEDFDLDVTVHLKVMEEELQKQRYKYPHDNYKAELGVDDIGHSEKVVCIGIEIIDEE